MSDRKNQFDVMPREHQVLLTFETGEPPAVKVICNMDPNDMTRPCATIDRGCSLVERMDEEDGVYQSQAVMWLVPDIDLTNRYPIAFERGNEPFLIVGEETPSRREDRW